LIKEEEDKRKKREKKKKKKRRGRRRTRQLLKYRRLYRNKKGYYFEFSATCKGCRSITNEPSIEHAFRVEMGSI
jgi:hypothetical protein